MSLALLRKTLAGVVTTLLLGATGAAHATYVVGTWDPTYGTPFTNLGWRGVATLQAASACLAAPGLVINNGSYCPLIAVINATVEFYDINTPLVTLETLDFTNKVAVTLLSVAAGNQADGFAMSNTGVVQSTHPLATAGLLATHFALDVQFVGGQSTAVLHWGTALDGELLGRNDPRYPADLRIATLPDPKPVSEPATLALAGIGAALAGLALARRRRALG